MSFLDNAKRALGIKTDDYYDDDRYDEEEYDEYEDEPKKSFFSFLKRDEYEDEGYEEPYEEEAPRRSYSSAYASRRTETRDRFAGEPRTSSPTRSSMAGVEVTVHYPTSLDDATRIIREVKVNKITLFDISAISSEAEARRVVDYIGGAAFGMECPFERLCPTIFCIAPTGVKFDVKKRY